MNTTHKVFALGSVQLWRKSRENPRLRSLTSAMKELVSYEKGGQGTLEVGSDGRPVREGDMQTSV